MRLVFSRQVWLQLFDIFVFKLLYLCLKLTDLLNQFCFFFWHWLNFSILLNSTVFFESRQNFIDLFAFCGHFVELFLENVYQKQDYFNLIFDFFHVLRQHFKVNQLQETAYFLFQLFHLLTPLEVQLLLQLFYSHINFTYFVIYHLWNAFETPQCDELVVKKSTFQCISLIFFTIALGHRFLMLQSLGQIQRLFASLFYYRQLCAHLIGPFINSNTLSIDSTFSRIHVFPKSHHETGLTQLQQMKEQTK